MKSGRRNLKNASSPKDLANQFSELQKLRIQVSKAELAATQERPAGVEAKSNGDSQGKTSNRGRTH
jgi:hypothetical protein